MSSVRFTRHRRGRRLVETVIAWAKAQNASSVVLWVVLWVMQTNEPAITLYRCSGVTPTGLVDTGPDDPCTDELEMRLVMANAR